MRTEKAASAAHDRDVGEPVEGAQVLADMNADDNVETSHTLADYQQDLRDASRWVAEQENELAIENARPQQWKSDKPKSDAPLGVLKAVQDAFSGLSPEELVALHEAPALQGGDCTAHTTSVVHGSTDSLQFSSHNVGCATERMLTRWKFEQKDSNQFYVYYTCCYFGGGTFKDGTCSTHHTGYQSIDLPGKTSSFTAMNQDMLKCPEDEYGHGKALSQFQMENQGGTRNFRFGFKCCTLAKSWIFPECVEKVTTQADDGAGKLSFLQYHNVNCGNNVVMTGWRVIAPATNKASIKYRCCTVAPDLFLPKASSVCAWWGDPHVMVFDNHKYTETKTTGYADWNKRVVDQMVSNRYWIVKNNFISIQALNCKTISSNSCYGTPAVTRRIAIGGKFMQNHRLIINPRTMDCTFDGKPIPDRTRAQQTVGWSFTSEGVVTVKHVSGSYWSNGVGTGWGFIIDLPLKVRLLVFRHPAHLDAILQMSQLPGGKHGHWNMGMDGHCGNFNNKIEDDLELLLKRRENNHVVLAEDDLFKDGVTIGSSGTVRTLNECSGSTRSAAEVACTAKVQRGTDMKEAWWKSCIYDVCFLGSSDYATYAGSVQNLYTKVIEAMKPAPYKIAASPVAPFALLEDAFEATTAVCGSGWEPAQIRSESEQLAIDELLENQAKDVSAISRLLLIGGKWVADSQSWIWLDGDDMNPSCAYSNFAYANDKWRTMPQSSSMALAIRKGDGKWLSAGHEVLTSYNIICQKKKSYETMGQTGATHARTVCGDGMQLAMPKTSAQQALLAAQVKFSAATAKVWLGAHFSVNEARWMWDDGSPVCGYTNWQSTNEPFTYPPEQLRPHDYPSCAPKCLNNFGGCPGGTPCHQVPGRIYRLLAANIHYCYRALSHCYGCLGNAKAYPEHLEPISCDGAATQENYLCMEVTSGKWVNCGHDRTLRMNSACQQSHEFVDKCNPGTYSGIQQGLSRNTSTTHVSYQGFCYYIGKGQESCDKVCESHYDGGRCDLVGTQMISESVTQCRAIVDGFGGIAYDSSKSGEVLADRTMCQYYEKRSMVQYGHGSYFKPKRAVELRKDKTQSGSYTSCQTKSADLHSHRICACYPKTYVDRSAGK